MTEGLSDLIEREFDPRLSLYLNHAAVAPWPARTRDAVTRFAAILAKDGARDYATLLSAETMARIRGARLIDADVSDVAFIKNTSEGLSFVAHGFPWRSGDRVVVPAGEFPSNRVVWSALAGRGVSVLPIALDRSADPEADLISALEPPTRLLSVSSVHYATGLRLDLPRLGEACRARRVALCVDAIQGLGYLPHPVTCGIDFLMADGHKWLLSPEGIGLFYCSPAWRERLALHAHGWHMLAASGDFSDESDTPAPSARRFECGSPNLLGLHALNASLSLLEEVGVSVMGGRIDRHITHLADGLSGLSGVIVTSPRAVTRRSGILSFRVPGLPAESIHRGLETRGVCAAVRAGGIRLSPHFYHSERDMVTVLELTVDALAEARRLAR